MAGNQSRGLIMASKTRGWDPTKIPSVDGGNESILPNFDKDQGNHRMYGDPSVGKLPDSIPAEQQGWPNGHDVLGVPSVSQPELDWQESQNDGQKPNRATKGANPYPGFGGEGY